jgi:prepilin-type N-terminal cleavage/methylation domain-containing protein
MKRSAFSLIELIFAIVIISIAVTSVPIMTYAIGKGVENNLVQETIFGASAQLNQILSYRWDENSIDESVDANATGLAKVINRAGVGSCLDNRLKPGHIAQPLHRRCLDNNTTRVSAVFGLDGIETVVDDIDDFNGTSGNLFTGSASGSAYKDAYTYSVSVSSSTMNGNLSPAESNDLKEVTITVFDNNGNTISSLNSYTFNIGEVDYYKRMYP